VLLVFDTDDNDELRLGFTVPVTAGGYTATPQIWIWRYVGVLELRRTVIRRL
jgi:hypothetical protein